MLWASAGGRIVGACLALLTLHALWNVVGERKSAWRWLPWGTLGFVLTLLTTETYPLLIAVFPLLALTLTIRDRSWKPLVYSLSISCSLAVVSALFFALFYYNKKTLEVRGSLDLNPLHVIERCQEYFSRLVWMTVSPYPGQALFSDAFHLGWTTILNNATGITLFSMTTAALAVTVFTWRTTQDEFLASTRSGLVVCVAGIAWCAITILLPGVLLEGPLLEYRTLHFPAAGASVAVGAAFWLLMKSLRHPLWPKICIAAGGIILLLNTILTLGYARAFAARSSLNQRQLTAVVQTLPSDMVPANSVLVTYETDEDLFETKDTISSFLVGVLETDWSAKAAFNQAYHRHDLDARTGNRVTKLRFKYDCEKEPAPETLSIKDPYSKNFHVFRLDQILMFSCKTDEVAVVEKLKIDGPDGRKCVVRFPIAAKLKQRGVKVISAIGSE